MLNRMFRWIAAVLRERQAYHELRRLDQRTLRDIGLERGQIDTRF